MQELKIFEEKQIRTIWDEVQEAELMYKLFDLVSGNLE